ncbi:MAG: RNA methyltransferase [Bacteroidales bacterium]|nr:RNA methyltransferase [Bacteroidales bacterium]
MEFLNQLTKNQQLAFLEHLNQFVNTERKKKFDKLVELRTRYLTIVLEDIFQPHNASAVLRSCDCFGIQDVHIIENRNKYQVNRDVALGSPKWLDLKRYNSSDFNTPEAYEVLKQRGYTIVATSPHKNDCSIEELPLDKPVAIVFGTEKVGLTQYAINNADAWVKIPMVGFTESLNISVSAAITLYTLTQRLYNENIPWQMNPSEKVEVLIHWAMNTLNKSESVARNFVNNLMQLSQQS